MAETHYNPLSEAGCSSVVFSQCIPDGGWDNAQSSEVLPGAAPFSLIFIFDRESRQVLLGLKRRGFGHGLYNGYGGKPDPGETMLDCARRELEEESGIVVNPDSLIPKGEMNIVAPALKDHSRTEVIRIHLYVCHRWSQEPIETEEMSPKWFDMDKLPFDQMWPESSLYVLPLLESADDAILDGYIRYEMVAHDATEDWKLIRSISTPAKDLVESMTGWSFAWRSS